MAEKKPDIADVLWGNKDILVDDLHALLGQALAQMQQWVAAWEVVGIAIRALNDPVRLRQLARAILADEEKHPAQTLYEVFPELLDLEDSQAAYKRRYMRALDDEDEDDVFDL